MAEPRIGIRAAARQCNRNPVVLYVAAAKRVLPSTVVDGDILFDPGDVKLWHDRVLAAETTRLRKSIAEREAKFAEVNRKR